MARFEVNLTLVALSPGDVIIRKADADAARDALMQAIAALPVYDPDPEDVASGAAEPATDYPGSWRGRTFPEWLALLQPYAKES